jgi:hypothetical protein
MGLGSEFAHREKARLIAIGGETLYPSFREAIMRYYREHSISWWGGSEGPTDNPISSQVACINHLEPARLHRGIALELARKHVADAIDVLPIEGGFLAYEWIGNRSYLAERGWSSKSRGRNITSVDALMSVKRTNGRVCLIIIEWKFTECYSGVSLAVSKKGTPRTEIYSPLLEHPDCPIQRGKHERLFFDPYDQLMRQTLLAWQMVEHGEFGATEWIHLHVAPKSNFRLLRSVTSPDLAPFGTMERAWRSVLVNPERYRLASPNAVLPPVGISEQTDAWLAWMGVRYGVND